MPLDSSTSITIAGIQCWDEGTKESFGRERSTASRQLLCYWADRITLINSVRTNLGTAIIQSTSTGNIIVGYEAPQSYPDAPWLFVDTVEVEGIPGENGLSVGTNGMVAYKYARIRFNYGQLPYYESGGGFPVETGVLSVDFGGAMDTLPQTDGILTFTDMAGGVVKAASNPIIFYNVASFQRSRLNQPSIPTNLIMAAQDCSNQAVFYGAPIGTVKFDGAKSQRKLYAGGTAGWDIYYAFSYKKVGWNSIVDSTTGKYRPVKYTSDNSLPYPYYDFNILFL